MATACLPFFQNLYDRVAGDDIDTGDELECYPKEFNTHHPHSPNTPYYKDIKPNPRDVSTSKETKIGKSHNGHRIESPIPVPRSNKISSHSPVDVNEEKVVMRITPRPPIRKRPKSTPVLDQVSTQLSQMMEDKMRYIN